MPNEEKKPEKIVVAAQADPQSKIKRPNNLGVPKKPAKVAVPAKVEPVVVGKPENFLILHSIRRGHDIIEEVSAVKVPAGVILKCVTPGGCSLVYVPHVQIIKDDNGGHYLQH